MKSLISLLQCVLIDLGTRCGTSTTNDLKTIVRRFEHEGLSFLTITLSNFGEDFQKSLDQGCVAHDQFPGFSRSGGLPRFLGGFLELVFDRDSGRLLDEPDVDAIFAVRQISLMFSKISADCTRSRVRKALIRYIECEQDVRLADQRLFSEPDRLERFVRIGKLLWADMFSRIDSRIYHESVVPKHGPGATADQLRGNAKYNQVLWTRRLDDVFPHWEHIAPSDHPSAIKWTDRVTVLEPREEIPVKVITVPKTLKTPRIIAEEPTCMQYMQQGVLSVMVQEISRSDKARNLVMFESQEPNQRLAAEGSVSGTLATLDLSEASDRVSNQHVRLLVSNHRFLREAVDATRSRKAGVLVDEELKLLRLAKFASMGSALCFPMEAIVFATVIFCGIERALSRTLTEEDVRSFFGRVRVYGDDIIVPVDYVQPVIEELEAFGFRVNSAKSFWTGRFRESCGKEFYAGRDVSIARCRSILPRGKLSAEELASAVALRNHLFHKGFDTAVSFLDDRISREIPFPIVAWTKVQGEVVQTSPLLGRHTYEPCQFEKYDKKLHRPLVKGVVLQPTLPTSSLDGYGALMKWFLSVEGRKPDNLGFYDVPLAKDHLQRAGRPVSVRIKDRWASPV